MEMAAGVGARRPRWCWATLLVLHCCQILSLVPWLFLAGFSFMAFDAPGSTKQQEAWQLVIAIWSYPLWLFAAATLSWLLFVLRHPTAAVVLATFFTLPTLGIGVALVLASWHGG